MTRFDGADLSHYQDDAGPIDWPTLRANSWWCATKATQGARSTDPTFTEHRRQMGLQRFTHQLFYHWLSPNVDPHTQADHYLDTVLPLTPPEGAMLDAEEAGITVDQVLAWCETVEAITMRPAAVYTGAYTAGGTIWQSTKVRHSAYGPRPMHLAAYTTEAEALKLPGVKAYPWSAWQYSSNGPVPGVVGRCDMNRIDNIAHYDTACGVFTPVPPPPLEDDDVKPLYFSIEDAPGGLYLWVPGAQPFAFVDVANAQAVLTGMGIDPNSGKSISREQYNRIMAATAPGAAAPVGARTVKLTGTVE